MTTAGDLVQETLGYMLSGQSPEVNRLNGSVTSNATTINMKYAVGSMQKGAIIAIDLEEIRVWEVSGQAVVVERGINGTTGAAHADLAYVEVQPKFSQFRILRAINQEILDLSSPVNGLFQVKTVDITYNPANQGYDLAGVTDIINLLELRYKIAGPTHKWPVITKTELGRNMATTEFASSRAIFLSQGAYPGFPIRVRYSADFNTLTNLTDDVQTVSNLPSTANDIPPIGAAIRLVGAREIKRNFTEAQFDPHRLEEIPAGAVAASIKPMEMLRQQRIIAEAARLESDWPIRLL